MATILFHPAFSDRHALCDQLYRAIWHFSPMVDRITRLIFCYSGPDFDDIDAEQCLASAQSFINEDFDPVITEIAPKFAGRVSILSPGQEMEQISGLHAVLVWETSKHEKVNEAQRIAKSHEAEVVLVDPKKVQQETLHTIRFAYSMWKAEELNQLVEESFLNFQRHTAPWTGQPVCAFGNGPSLAKVVDQKSQLGVSIKAVCNSTIEDHNALDFLKPQLLFCGDPVQHCGVSRYAGQFRKALSRALEDPSRVLFTQLGYVPYFRAATPARCHDRIIGIGNDQRPAFNLDLNTEFLTAATANIFTMLVLPVACTISNNIEIFGCDGMPYADSTKPWSHSDEDSYISRMSVTHRVHRSFWQRNYEEEYWSYCRDLSELLSSAEREGHRISVRTPSYVPALAKRYTPI